MDSALSRRVQSPHSPALKKEGELKKHPGKGNEEMWLEENAPPRE